MLIKGIMTKRQMAKRLVTIDDRINSELTPALESLNSQYEGIKNRRTEEAMNAKADNRARAYTIRTEIKNLKLEHDRLEWKLEKSKRDTWAVFLWVLSGLLFFGGIALCVWYKYRLGLFGLTDTHDLVSIISGDNPVMDIELYKSLFWTHVAGISFVIIGIIGSGSTSAWYAITD